MAVPTFPKFAGIGRTASLLDEELLLLGDDYLGTRGRYISIQRPRDGVLAMKYTIQDLPLRQSPHQHSSMVSRNTLTVVGGKFKSRGMLSKFTWTELSLKWKNGTKYIPDFVNACSVKLDVDIHIIFGGEGQATNQQINGRQVVKIDTTQEIAEELNSLTYSRVSHDCQLLNNSIVLLSGGLPQYGRDTSKILPDELYDITSEEVVKVLDQQQSLGRTQHAMIRIGYRILAFGGRDSNNDAPSKIAEFNPTTYSWKDFGQELHSTNTTELIVTPFPVASLDCVPQCRCGIANKTRRIFGGNETEVRTTSPVFINLTFSQANAYPWIAPLLRDEDSAADYVNSRCSAVLVSTSPAISSNFYQT